MGPKQYLKTVGKTAIEGAVRRWTLIYRHITVVDIIFTQIKKLKKTVKHFGPGNQINYGELNTELLKQMKFQIAPHILENIFKKMCVDFLFIYLFKRCFIYFGEFSRDINCDSIFIVIYILIVTDGDYRRPEMISCE